MNVRLLLAGAVTGAAAIGLSAGTAGAAVRQDVIMLTCNGVTEQVVLEGSGRFTPARSLDGTAVYVPLAFGDFTGTVTDGAGNVVEQFTEPGPILKGAIGTGVRNTVSCTYTQTFVGDGSDPNFPLGYTFVGEGSATALVTPQGRK